MIVVHRLSASQLSIDVAALHPGPTGRVEITCLATIPAHVDIGEEFADYKTYSVKSKCKQFFLCKFFKKKAQNINKLYFLFICIFHIR